jgi:rSAM/selenodomain-associated transferase 2
MRTQPTTLPKVPKISVIIPALNEETNIEASIRDVRRNYSSDQVEILVVDGGSVDATLNRIPSGVTVITTHANRANQMNTGAQRSTGDVLVFCHADTRLPSGWREAVLNVLEKPGVVGGAFQSRLEPERGPLKWMNKVRLPADWRFMYGDQAMFLTRRVFEQIGGFPEIILMEDVELARGMAKLGAVTRIESRVITDSRRMLEKGPFRQIVGNMWRIFRYLYLGATPEQIAKTYHSSREDSE